MSLEISKILNIMDLLFLPSRSEGFPKVILEAAASGIFEQGKIDINFKISLTKPRNETSLV